MDVLRRAADLMIASGDHGLEPDLNRQLLLYMRQAIRNLEEEGLYVPPTDPILEALNQPTPSTKGASSEKKRPDLQWGYRDSQVADPMDAMRTFHIECKRIGTSTLNPLYVKEGIWRFIDEVWSYGKDVSDGGMVGYVEGRGSNSALLGVNAAASATGVPTLIETSKHGARREHSHELTRAFEKSPFRLRHVWIDTRTFHSLSTSKSPTQTRGEISRIPSVTDGDARA